MNAFRLYRRLLPVVALLASSTAAPAQDLVSPKQREKIVADAVRVAEARGKIQPLPSPLPNPFVPKEAEAAIAQSVPAAPVVPAAPITPKLVGGELLATLAARIPATGTVSLGGNPILLVGQKRLKVGDTFTISFEGQSYDLSIAAVTPTSFTVKRGENIHTRPVKMPAASTNTPTNRP